MITAEHAVRTIEHLDEFMTCKRKLRNKMDTMSLQISLTGLLSRLYALFSKKGIKVSDDSICLVGSSASSFIGPNPSKCIEEANDVDVTIYLSEPADFWEVLNVEEQVISDLVKSQLGIDLSLREVYHQFFLESVHVDNESDSWSLITVGCAEFTIDIKVIYKQSRHFAFSIDSFEIVLNDLIFNGKKEVIVRSTYGNFIEAFLHLVSRTIHTRYPSSIRRGIFRYSLEIAKGNRPPPNAGMYYNSIFLESFYDEFEEKSTELFENVVSKFMEKHKKQWKNSLQVLYQLIVLEKKESNIRFLDVLRKKITEIPAA